ncbi:hypothetical protein D3C87_2162380 [compost metagenome]
MVRVAVIKFKIHDRQKIYFRKLVIPMGDYSNALFLNQISRIENASVFKIFNLSFLHFYDELFAIVASAV